ncbi:MAG: hypothetical protein ABFD25_06510 [Clostridiaceae bacterium]
MIYLLVVLLAAVSYHTFSYGKYLIKKEKNRLAAFGAILMGIINLVVPILFLILRY